MSWLPLANLLHYKLRSFLSAIGISIGVCMLITLSGLSRGSLYEIADRWEAVDADLVVLPRGWGLSATEKSGIGLSDKYADRILDEHGDMVHKVVPVFAWPMRLAGQDQMVAGVDSHQWRTLTGGRDLLSGRLFDPQSEFSRWLENKLLAPSDDVTFVDITDEDLSAHGGLEMVIDTRLAEAGGYELNQTVTAANHCWKIVGIVPAGAMRRVFVPRRTAQFLFGNGDITTSTVMFVKLRAGVDPQAASDAISASTHQDVMPLDYYRGMLVEKFGIMFLYVDTVNVVALIIAFLFIMITLYTMVLQRTREIAILKAQGASNFFLLHQVLGESLLLSAVGLVLGVGLSFLAGWTIQEIKPLLTVTIQWRWILMAVAAALAGALISALYPAWRAMKVDVLEALRVE